MDGEVALFVSGLFEGGADKPVCADLAVNFKRQ